MIKIKLGMMYAYGLMQDWDMVDTILQDIDDDLWLTTETFSNMQDLQEFVQAEFEVSLYELHYD